MHGYRLVEIVETGLRSCTDLKKPTAYFLLGKLARAGMVTRTRTREGKRPPKWVYRLTPKGEDNFQSMLRKNLAEFIAPKNPGSAGLAFVDALPLVEGASAPCAAHGGPGGVRRHPSCRCTRSGTRAGDLARTSAFAGGAHLAAGSAAQWPGAQGQRLVIGPLRQARARGMTPRGELLDRGSPASVPAPRSHEGWLTARSPACVAGGQPGSAGAAFSEVCAK